MIGFKWNTHFIFLCNPQKSSVNVFLIQNNKKHCHKKSICVFLYLRRSKLFKVTAFAIFQTSKMILFEIHQRFKGRFLNELHVSFKKTCSVLLHLLDGLIQSKKQLNILTYHLLQGSSILLWLVIKGVWYNKNLLMKFL